MRKHKTCVLLVKCIVKGCTENRDVDVRKVLLFYFYYTLLYVYIYIDGQIDR